MAKREHVEILTKGVDTWNKWRESNPEEKPDLIGANLSWTNLINANLREANLQRANLRGANLSLADLSKSNLSNTDLNSAKLNKTNLSEADLSWADLTYGMVNDANLVNACLRGTNFTEADLRAADLRGADLSWANLNMANLGKANLSRANLKGANLTGANLNWANLNKADLSWADLSWTQLNGTTLIEARLIGTFFTYAHMVNTNLERAFLENCSIYGASTWGLNLNGATQSGYIVTPPGEPAVVVDDFEIGQLIYLLLKSEKLGSFIESIATKLVLVIGNRAERESVLDEICKGISKHNHLPVVFDVNRGLANSQTVETAFILAQIARFTISDLSDTKSNPPEVELLVTNALRSKEYIPDNWTDKIINDISNLGWSLKVLRCEGKDFLLSYLQEKILGAQTSHKSTTQGS
ncbi:MAG: hypothetical protein KatS3mg078_2309 [Deltaproteobacteria bacterium]|jgi:uncharacterized protein YjbI with pentapeptide repeats|nr:MAG: hypothetical protein KatS3mg078_2309 [Deltaproteobacteria bacterium]